MNMSNILKHIRVVISPQKWTLVIPKHSFHNTPRTMLFEARDKDHEEKEKKLIVQKGSIFDEAAKKSRDKKTFNSALKKYIQRDKFYKRSHVEFIYAAMDRMKEFAVERDRETYKNVLELFPKKKMVVQTHWQAEMMHYPKQQQCAIDILCKMEDNGVIPDDDMGYQLIGIFGKESHVFRKYQRMMYWMPKFKNMNPYPVPYELPTDPTELAQLALKRMAVDLENKITVFQTSDVDGSLHDTFVVSAQSPDQCKLLREQPTDRPLFVEGGFSVWLRGKQLIYFILRSDMSLRLKKFKENKNQKQEGFFSWKPLYHDESSPFCPIPVPSVHEQDDGTVLAMCITGTSSKDSLISWVKLLQKENPKLGEIPVVFTLITPEMGIEVVEEKQESQVQ